MRSLTVLLTIFCMWATFVLADTWTISSLDTHYMGKDSGIPGGWPKGSEFNASISFTLQRVSRASASPFTTKCGCNWTEPLPSPTADGKPPYPRGVWQICDKDGIAWRIRNEDYVNAGYFSIEILVPEIDGVAMVTDKHTNLGLSYATVRITSNNASDPSSYLTCMGGAPFTGIHCGYTVYNIVLGLGIPITLNMSARQDTTTPPFNITNLQYKQPNPKASNKGVNCLDGGTSFDIISNGTKPVHCSGNTCAFANQVTFCAGSGLGFYWTNATADESHWTPTLRVFRTDRQRLAVKDLDGHQVEAPMVLLGTQAISSQDSSQNCGSPGQGTCASQQSTGLGYVVPVFYYFVERGDTPYPMIPPTQY